MTSNNHAYNERQKAHGKKRRARVLRLLEGGKSAAQVAAIMGGMSRQRVSFMANKAKEERK